MIHERGGCVNTFLCTKNTAPRRGVFRAHNYLVTDNYENSCTDDCIKKRYAIKIIPVDNCQKVRSKATILFEHPVKSFAPQNKNPKDFYFTG